ncbi:G patch domain and ankyrin repeat-containing protein 1 [Choanephora cucurbitarum]|uniref:G patch domain and ankyrin repeat-containing protein 1 n=1 Tax=Choanephora cucurbitarum TaxID=101091 RepID=A0A1C7NM41_9FUNG|nr:G patch domain and ankyrin repeat-containing protein 1 [Choanephora cucurbitarum]
MSNNLNNAKKTTIVSKYARPIHFVAAKEQKEKPLKRQKKESDGQQVASLYHSIVSTNAKKNKEVKEEMTFCEDCQLNTKDYKRHLLGTAHMVSSKSTVAAPDLLKLDGRNVGFQMMVSQGWQHEVGGLGPQQSGRRHPIATVLKQDRLGIGHQATGKKAITHTHEEIEKKKRKETTEVMDPGREIARRARNESQRRVAMLHYLKN